MSKHTPGPWDTRRTVDGMVGSEKQLVAAVYGDDPNCMPDDTMRANARLIAAAPDLLAIAQMVANLGKYRELIDAMANTLRPHERAAFVKLFREDARAAIAKATEAA